MKMNSIFPMIMLIILIISIVHSNSEHYSSITSTRYRVNDKYKDVIEKPYVSNKMINSTSGTIEYGKMTQSEINTRDFYKKYETQRGKLIKNLDSGSLVHNELERFDYGKHVTFFTSAVENGFPNIYDYASPAHVHQTIESNVVTPETEKKVLEDHRNSSGRCSIGNTATTIASSSCGKYNNNTCTSEIAPLINIF